MKLDPKAVSEANEKLWKENPELGGRQLTMEPEDAPYRKQWMENYKNAENKPPKPPPPKVQPQPVTNPPPAANAAEPCVRCAIARMTHEEKMEAAIKAAKNGPFATADDAARAALTDANPKSIRDNLEYGGLVYKDSKGDYYFTGPIMGSDQGVDPAMAAAPAGATIVADYHTHADYSLADPHTGAAIRTSDPSRDDFNSDDFSTQDKRSAKELGYDAYLGTPNGSFLRYDYADGSKSTL